MEEPKQEDKYACLKAVGGGALDGVIDPQALIGDALTAALGRGQSRNCRPCSPSAWTSAELRKSFAARFSAVGDDSGSSRRRLCLLYRSEVQVMWRKIAQVCAALGVLGAYWLMIYLGLGMLPSALIAFIIIVAIYYAFRDRGS
jgi:hypothetical protein